MSAATGRHLSGVDHLIQSIRDVLSTPVGSRVMRRDYGSRLYELLDRPITPSTILAISVATVEAILRWEPRVEVERVEVMRAGAGHVELAVSFLAGEARAVAEVALGVRA